MMVHRIINRFGLSLLVVGTILTTGGCYYDVEEVLYPGGCNPQDVSYSGTIVPILQRECYGCHGMLTQNGGINLQGYTQVIKYVQNGQFLGAIRHESGFSPMPDGLPMLNDCTIQKIELWVEEGAQDN
jgi:hypothetical protein